MQAALQELESSLSALQAETRRRTEAAAQPPEIEEIRRGLFGKKGALTLLLRGLGGLPTEERPAAGQLVNQARQELESHLSQRESALLRAARDQALAAEAIDVTLPAAPSPFGKPHPLAQVTADVVRIFSGLGYGVEEGPEVETSYYNFDALNIGPDHPARAERDSLFIDDDLVLRTETSAVQIRVMEGRQPPVKIIAPGRVYRRDAVDRTHSPIFHQVEGLLVDRHVSLGDLKGTLITFLHQLFEAVPGTGPIAIRFRPHFFPFTEPSAEFDVYFRGQWLELGGCGMVHPAVLERVGYDSEKYTGFAFGFGIERMAMIKFGIDDIRLFYDNDIAFLNQF